MLKTKHLFNAQDPVIPVYFPGVLYRLLKKEGIEDSALLAGSTLSPASFTDENTRISFEAHSVFIKNAMQAANDPHLGWRFGQHITITALGMLGFAVMSASHVEAAMETVTRFFKIRAPLYDLKFIKHANADNDAALEIEESLEFGDNRYFLLTSAVSGIEHVTAYFAQVPQIVKRAEFACPEPENWQAFEAHVPYPVRFDAGSTRVYFDAAVLTAPIPTADPQTEKSTTAICQQLLASVENQAGIVKEVKEYILNNERKYPSLNEAAHHFCMSPRTLRRALQKSGTTYQHVLDKVRKAIAIELLSTTTMTVNEIAFELGYSDAANFSRAFRSWVGRKPSDYRQR